MKFEWKNKNNKTAYLWAIGICLLVGTLGALVVSGESSGYGASMTYWLLVLFCLFPLILILFVGAIIAAIQDKAKHTLILLMSCLLLPVSFFGSLKLMEATKLAKYKQVSEEMTPIGSKLNERIVVAFKETASQEETHKFDETILRKTISQPNGILLEFADGVCGIAYPNTEFKYEIVDVGFVMMQRTRKKKQLRKG